MPDFIHSSTAQGQAFTSSAQEASTGAPGSLLSYTQSQQLSSDFAQDSGSSASHATGNRFSPEDGTLDGTLDRLIDSYRRAKRWPSSYTLYRLWRSEHLANVEDLNARNSLIDRLWTFESEETREFFRDKADQLKAEDAEQHSNSELLRRRRTEPMNQQASEAPSTSRPSSSATGLTYNVASTHEANTLYLRLARALASCSSSDLTSPAQDDRDATTSANLSAPPTVCEPELPPLNVFADPHFQLDSSSDGSSGLQRVSARTESRAQRAHNPYLQSGRTRVADTVYDEPIEDIVNMEQWWVDAGGQPLVVGHPSPDFMFDSLVGQGVIAPEA
ncbi:hypothetical protein EST38_g9177 [Candolleomyces aberdarensis]|uniref:Uncharacterized protein n=1 Tax=Candolleomyces aberdarensis TaxID=2316362 RepID=A0A4Q2DBE2_9AGAR|nr:hypothetical protein EST38_g9177 [Candolleomyces aberdarensis]